MEFKFEILIPHPIPSYNLNQTTTKFQLQGVKTWQ
jgi:hypothetical protein